jgi:hypothetical protein
VIAPSVSEVAVASCLKMDTATEDTNGTMEKLYLKGKYMYILLRHMPYLRSPPPPKIVTFLIC